MRKIYALVIALFLVTGIPILAQADNPIPGTLNLYDRGGGFIYDADLNITWYDAPSIERNWYDADNWVKTLTVINIYGKSITGWRLPSAYNEDGSGPSYGYNITESEMGHLYYIELGNKAYPESNSNMGPFKYLQLDNYWSGTDYTPISGWASEFDFHHGGQTAYDKIVPFDAMAVHEGDVGRVPEPATMLLLGLGLMGLVGVRRKFKN